MKALKINPKHINIVKKAKDKFKNMLASKTKEENHFSNNNLLYNIAKPKINDYQKLYSAYE